MFLTLLLLSRLTALNEEQVMPWSRAPAEAVLVSLQVALNGAVEATEGLAQKGCGARGAGRLSGLGRGSVGTWSSTSVCSSLSPEEEQGRLGPPHVCFTSAFGTAG